MGNHSRGNVSLHHSLSFSQILESWIENRKIQSLILLWYAHRYNSTLEKDESDLLDLFRRLDEGYGKMYPVRDTGDVLEPDGIPKYDDDKVKVETRISEANLEGERGRTERDVNRGFQMDGFCVSSYGSAPDSERGRKKRRLCN